MSLIFTLEEIHPLSSSPDIHKTYLQYFSAYDLPIVEDLVWYFHAFVGFTVQYKWLKAIKAGKFASWPGITYHNSSKYYPIADETLKRHMVQLCQGVRSTKPNPYWAKCNTIPKATDIPSDTNHPIKCTSGLNTPEKFILTTLADFLSARAVEINI